MSPSALPTPALNLYGTLPYFIAVVVTRQDWRDDRLTWNAEEFDNLSNVVMHSDRIWLPELALMNGFV